MKAYILIAIIIIIVGVEAYLFLTNYRHDEVPLRPTYGVNAQALSNGLIVIDKKLIPEADGKSGKIYATTCYFCHDLPDPASHDALEWGFVVDRMEEFIIKSRKIKSRESIVWSEEIKKDILAYLEQHSFKGMDPDKLPDKPEKGAKLFKKLCPTCHTLPDPSMHSPKIWEYVINKMQHFQGDMGQAVMTDVEVAALLEYFETFQNEKKPKGKLK